MARKSKLHLFLESLPEATSFITQDTISKVFAEEDETLRRIRARKGGCKCEWLFTPRADGFFFGEKVTSVGLIGNRVVPTSQWTDTIVLQGNRLWVKKNRGTNESVAVLFDIFKIRWASQLCRDNLYNWLLARPAIVKGILLGDIRSEADIYRSYARMNRIANPNWKVLREYIQNDYGVSICDLRDGTTDAIAMMRRLASAVADERGILRDCIRQALVLGRRVNPKWSVRRLYEEHNAWSEHLLALESDSYSSSPIYEGFDMEVFAGYGVELLNSERRIFEESERAHNCLFSCYLDRCESHRYIPFHASLGGEEVTFGVHMSEGEPVLEQAKLPCNKKVSEKSAMVINIFVQSFRDLFRKMLDGYNPKTQVRLAPVGMYVDLPF